MSDAMDAGGVSEAAPSAPEVPVAPPVSEVVEVREATPPEIAQEVVPIPDAIEQVTVPEVLPEIVSIESGEVAAPPSSNPAPTPPPQPAASAAPTSDMSLPSIKERRMAALEKRQSKKRANLDKIMQLVATKSPIKNDDVEKLLHVSNATATRYLMQLVREEKLQKNGSRRGAHYLVV